MSFGPNSRRRCSNALVSKRNASRVFASSHSHATNGSPKCCLASRIVTHAGDFFLGVVDQARDAKRVAAGMFVWIAALDETGENTKHFVGGHSFALGAVALSRDPSRLNVAVAPNPKSNSVIRLRWRLAPDCV